MLITCSTVWLWVSCFLLNALILHSHSKFDVVWLQNVHLKNKGSLPAEAVKPASTIGKQLLSGLIENPCIKVHGMLVLLSGVVRDLLAPLHACRARAVQQKLPSFLICICIICCCITMLCISSIHMLACAWKSKWWLFACRHLEAEVWLRWQGD